MTITRGQKSVGLTSGTTQQSTLPLPQQVPTLEDEVARLLQRFDNLETLVERKADNNTLRSAIRISPEAILLEAQDVGVLGTFTVADIIKDQNGTAPGVVPISITQIRGDVIRTGTILSNNFGALAGTSINLNDGTIIIGGTDAPSLEFIGGDLTISGKLTASSLILTNNRTLGQIATAADAALPSASFGSTLQSSLDAGVNNIIAGISGDYRLDVSTASIIAKHKDANEAGLGSGYSGTIRTGLIITANGIAMGYNNKSSGAWVNAVSVSSTGDIVLGGSITAAQITGGTLNAEITTTNNLILGASGKIYTTGKTSAASTTAGIFLGHDGGVYKFAVGDATRSIAWDGSALTVTGEIINTTNIQGGAVTTAKLDALAVTAEKVAANAIETAKIANAAVEAGKIASNAVTSDKIDALAVTAAKVAAGAIETAKIADAAVEAGKIAANAVTTEKINALAVTAAKVAASAIETSKIADLAVETGKLANAAATEAKIATNAITETKISDLAISTPKLAAGAVTAAKITAGTITAAEIAAATITGAKIAAGTIAAGNIAALTITAGEIASNAITTDKILASAITAAKIAAGTITAAEIAASTITGAKIAAGTITASNIAALTITAAEIAATTITGAKIAALTIEAGNIAANAITAGKINAGAVTSGTIAAGAVTAGTIAANAVTATEIAADAITAAKILAGEITGDKISSTFTTTSNLILSTNGKLYSSGKTSAVSTTAGVFLGWDTNESISAYKFVIGDNTKELRWNGSALTIKGGDITGTGFLRITGTLFDIDTNAAVNGSPTNAAATGVLGRTGTGTGVLGTASSTGTGVLGAGATGVRGLGALGGHFTNDAFSGGVALRASTFSATAIAVDIPQGYIDRPKASAANTGILEVWDTGTNTSQGTFYYEFRQA